MSTRATVMPTAEVALAAATAKTVLQITAGANDKVWITRIGISFDGVDPAAAPGTVMIYRQTGGTLSSVTPAKFDPDDTGTLSATAGYNASGEPTNTTLVDGWNVHPQTGLDVFFPLGLEIPVPAGAKLGIVCNFAGAVNCIPKIWFRE